MQTKTNYEQKNKSQQESERLGGPLSLASIFEVVLKDISKAHQDPEFNKAVNESQILNKAGTHKHE
jgi:hypothetical protein